MPSPTEAHPEPARILVAVLLSDLDGTAGPDENARAFLVALELAGYAIVPGAEGRL